MCALIFFVLPMFCSHSAFPSYVLTDLCVLHQQDLHARYPGTDESGLHLLQSMLRFDPRHRVSVDAALSHPYLAAVRNVSKETVASVPMSDRIESIGEDQDHLHANVSK